MGLSGLVSELIEDKAKLNPAWLELEQYHNIPIKPVSTRAKFCDQRILTQYQHSFKIFISEISLDKNKKFQYNIVHNAPLT